MYNMMHFPDLVSHLAIRLKEPLPGLPAQLRMASESRLKWLREGMDSSRARKCGVLILIYPANGGIRTVLILRTDYDGAHGGQVGLPGGKQEESDSTLIDTALREIHEELGIVIKNVRILGTMSELYIPPSNFLVLPVVGCLEEKPVFQPDPNEVQDIIEVDLSHLFDPHFRVIKEIHVHGHTFSAPCFLINGAVIWGATAMILSEFAELVSGIWYKVYR